MRGMDIPKIIAALVALLEEQEEVKITYTLDRIAENGTGR